MTTGSPNLEKKTEKKSPFQHLEKCKKELVSALSFDAILKALRQVDQNLPKQPLVFQGSLQMHNLINDIFKPITRQITNSYIRQESTVNVMQSIIRKIVMQYISIFRNYGNSSVLQILKELLQRNTFLFLKQKHDNNRFKPGTEMIIQASDNMAQSFNQPVQEEKIQGTKNQSNNGSQKFEANNKQWPQIQSQSAAAYQQQTQNKEPILVDPAINPEFGLQQSKQQMIAEVKYRWVISQHNRYTIFFLSLIQSVITGLQGAQDQFSTLSLDSISQYYSLLYAINEVLNKQKLLEIVRKGFCVLASNFNNPSKQMIKEANKDSLEKLSDSMNDCIRYQNDYDLKIQIALLGPTLGIQLFKQSTIYEKMQGLKIINKYVSSINYRHVNNLPQSQFGKWLNNEHIFEMIYNLDSSLSIIQAADDIFKCYARCRLLSKQLIQKYINLIDVCQSQTRIHLIKLLESISLKIQYEEVFIILEKFQNLRKIQYYTEDFFTMISAICKYNNQNANRKAFHILECIVNEYYQHFTSSIQSKCMNCCITIFNNIIDKMSFGKSKLDDTVKIVENFLSNPTPFNLTLMKKVFQIFPQNVRVTKNTLSTCIVEKLKFFDRFLNILEKVKHLNSEDLKSLINFLLNHYRFNKSQFELKDIQALFPYENMIKLSYYPQIFCLIVEFVYREKSRMLYEIAACWKFLQNLLTKLLQHLATTEQASPFQCIKILFCLINDKKITRVDTDIAQRQFQYSQNPKDFIRFDSLKQLLYSTKFSQIRRDCASFIVQMYTLPQQNFMEQSQKLLLPFIQQSISQLNQAYSQYITSKTHQNNNKLIGVLYLLLQLLSATEPFGVGELACHSSLVATGTIVVRINNQFTNGEDVLKVFEKKFPSNTTVFQVIKEACIQFKCSPEDVLLRTSYKKFIPLKYNSWTLEQFPFDCKALTISKAFRNLIHKKPLLNQKGQLTPEAKQAFTKIFKMFAGQGQMGKKQCAEFVSKATQSTFNIFDYKITKFYQQYDKNRDGLVNLQEFLRFFHDNSIDKPSVVWKNLTWLRFRRDLKYFNEPIQLGDKNLMLRTHLCSSNKIYELLFNLLQSNQQNNQLFDLTKQFLNRLPTYPKVINSIEQSFNMLSNNAFLSQYILIALQQQLNKKVQDYMEDNNPLQYFIKNKFYLKIYDYLISLSQEGKDQQRCRAICLHILRFLIPIPSLQNQIGFGKQKELIQNINLSAQGGLIQLPQNKLFQNLLKDSLKTCDIETYEISLVLLLTQKSFESSWLKRGIFHLQQEIRRITCNFVLLSTKVNPQAFDLFEMEQEQLCSQWFQLLVQIILYTKKSVDLNKIFLKKCQRALCRQETLQKIYDPILNGNLNIIKTILLKSQHINSNLMQQQYEGKQFQLQQLGKSSSSKDKQIQLKIPQPLCDMFIELLTRTLSNENRRTLYELISMLNIDKSIQLLLQLIDKQYPTRQAQLRQHFVGIKNLGSICYMNSILQQFFFIADFRNFVMGLENKKKIKIVQLKGKKIVDDFLYQLQKMYIELFYSQKKYFDPTDFCLTIKDQQGQPISTTVQQDAHQFLNQLFETLEKYIKIAKTYAMVPQDQKKSIQQKRQQIIQKKQSNDNADNLQMKQQMVPSNYCIIQELNIKKQKQIQNVLQKSFAGKTATLITCRTCENRNIRKQDITHLTVQVKGMSSLKDSFDKFTEYEEISEYQCDYCQKKVPSGSIQKLLYKLPDTLIINLLRITFDVNTFQNTKIHSKHQFPDQVNLKDYLFIDEKQPLEQQQTQYYLHGVVIHAGTSQSGHYYSLIKIDNQWYKFNDMSVSKFDKKDIPKQCFGGNETVDDWGQARFSTNAYILFYSRQKKQPRIRLGSLYEAEQLEKNIEMKQQVQQANKLQKYKNAYYFLPQISAENKRFYFQLQINQRSFFQFALCLYNQIKPCQIKEKIQSSAYLEDWDCHPNSKRYQFLLELFLKIVNFVAIYYDFNTNIICGIGQTTNELLFLVPERSYKFFMDIDPEIYFIHLTTHNESVLRQLYKFIITKALYVYNQYYGFNWKGFKIYQMEEDKKNKMIQPNKLSQQEEILNTYIENIPEECRQPCNLKIILLLKNYIDKILQDDTINKNLFKCNAFFEFWKISIIYNSNVLNFVLDNNLLEVLLDFIMAKDSPFKQINAKRQECPAPQSYSVLQCIALLQQFKLGLQDQPFPTSAQVQKLRTLTYREKKILSDPFFYRKMLRDKHDQQILSGTLASLCYQNKKFSQQIAQLLITGFSNFDNYESWLPLLSHIKMQLFLDDNLAKDRITWLLGIPQFSSIYKLDYSLRDNTASKSIQYVSNLFFVFQQRYQPLLQRLYQKRYRFDLLTINGIIALLELANHVDRVFNYVVNIAPPCYNMLTYVDWIQNFAEKLENEDVYGVPKSDKQTYIEQIKKLLDGYNKKKSYSKNIPSLKYIIGKNKSLEIVEIIDHAYYEIKFYRHKTYIIENIPTGKSNQSIPSDLYYHGHPIKKAKYFVHDTFSQQLPETNQIQSDYQVITLQIKTKKRLLLKFNSPTFNYEITTVKGDIDINLPYDPKPLKQLVQIMVLQDSIDKKQKYQQSKQDMFKIALQVVPPKIQNQPNILKQIECPSCTFLNLGLRNCQICDAVLPFQ